MLLKGEVIKILIPYMIGNSKLASIRHSYICIKAQNKRTELVKAQTSKPKWWEYKGGRRVMEKLGEYVDVNPSYDNGFIKPTRIDCKKVFVVNGVDFSRKIVLWVVSDNLLRRIFLNLKENVAIIPLDKSSLVALNGKEIESDK